jgi:N-acetylglutamate synthase-like GNAT family acetyltransferase
MPFWCKYMKVCLMKRNKNQFKASVKAFAVSDANNSSVGCHAPFLREVA